MRMWRPRRRFGRRKGYRRRSGKGFGRRKFFRKRGRFVFRPKWKRWSSRSKGKGKGRGRFKGKGNGRRTKGHLILLESSRERKLVLVKVKDL